uniref:Uncharacterized protein n=1 Tax=Eptatretus burgeri TaxID=7764 RepID=A0A8C4QBE9_EPTBU
MNPLCPPPRQASPAASRWCGSLLASWASPLVLLMSAGRNNKQGTSASGAGTHLGDLGDEEEAEEDHWWKKKKKKEKEKKKKKKKRRDPDHGDLEALTDPGFLALINSLQVLTMLACVGMWVPRAAMFMDHAASIYVGCYLHCFMELMLSESGNEGWPFHHRATLRLRTGPLCCCCLCLPNPKLSSRWLTALRSGTLQTAILRPLLVLLSILVWVDRMASDNWENTNSTLESVLGYVLGASTLLAIWVLSMAFFIVKNFTLPLPHLTARFALNQVLVLLVTLQLKVLRWLSSAGIVPCIPPFSRHAQATSMHHQLLIIEMFVVTLTSHRLYRRPVKDFDVSSALSSSRQTD